MCYKKIEEHLSQETAERKCVAGGGHLASITSPQEEHFLHEIVGHDDRWLGGHYIAEEGRWTWMDESQWRYTNWRIGYPTNVERADCIGLGLFSVNVWDHRPCSQKHQAICKKRACPEGWTHFNSNCYKLFEEHLAFEDAEAQCQKHGAHLASIHNQMENNFVTRYVKSEIWIGGSDKIQEGSWTWTDGSTWGDYSYWARNEPNNNHGIDDCLKMSVWRKGYVKNWWDMFCTDRVPFVCKKNQ